eukprot:110441_1
MSDIPAGDYVLSVSGFNGDYGRYQLVIFCGSSRICGSEITGSTSTPSDVDYYRITLSLPNIVVANEYTPTNTIPAILLNGCIGTDFNTILYLYDANHNKIAQNRDSDHCPLSRSQLNATDLAPGDYIVAVGGYSDYYGNYTLQFVCFSPLDVCVEHSPTTLSTWIDGVYTWYHYDSIDVGAVYYNSAKQRYIYPHRFNSGIGKYYIGSNYTTNTVSAKCELGDLTDEGYVFDLDDCIGNWMAYDDRWSKYPDMTVSFCQEVCSHDHYNASLDGIYFYDHFNITVRGSVYYCSLCTSEGMYLYPIIDNDRYYWMFDTVSSAMSWLVWCDVTDYAQLAGSSYVFKLKHCANRWMSWNGTQSILGNGSVEICYKSPLTPSPTDRGHYAEAAETHLIINCGTECIDILNASYGFNCDVTLMNNDLLNLQNACNNKTLCKYEIPKDIIDPASQCVKEYIYEYQCVHVCKKYVQHDRLNTLVDWKSDGSVHAVSSPNCPSATNYTAKFKGNKLCISNSMNAFWDGQYEWQYLDGNVQGSIYYNAKSNKYIYEYMEQHVEAYYYKYYINDYQQDTIIMTRCVTDGIIDIQYCMGNWQNHVYVPHNNSYAWITDSNMISTTCNDICMNGMSYSRLIDTIPYKATFMWSHYNISKTSNVYYCIGCQDNLYFYGFYVNDYTYKCVIELLYGSHIGTGVVLDWFTFTNNNHTLLSTKDCAHSLDEWQDGDLWITFCPANPNTALDRLETLPMFQESQICVQDSYHSLLDGEYRWLYYDFEIQGSIYYNKEKETYIQPYINGTGRRHYNIYGNRNNVTIHAKCEASVISRCGKNWQINYDSTWNVYTNMVATPCQDVCINGHPYQYGYGSEAVFRFLYFSQTERSNVYFSETQDGAGSILFI